MPAVKRFKGEKKKQTEKQKAHCNKEKFRKG